MKNALLRIISIVTALAVVGIYFFYYLPRRGPSQDEVLARERIMRQQLN